MAEMSNDTSTFEQYNQNDPLADQVLFDPNLSTESRPFKSWTETIEDLKLGLAPRQALQPWPAELSHWKQQPILHLYFPNLLQYDLNGEPFAGRAPKAQDGEKDDQSSTAGHAPSRYFAPPCIVCRFCQKDVSSIMKQDPVAGLPHFHYSAAERHVWAECPFFTQGTVPEEDWRMFCDAIWQADEEIRRPQSSTSPAHPSVSSPATRSIKLESDEERELISYEAMTSTTTLQTHTEATPPQPMPTSRPAFEPAPFIALQSFSQPIAPSKDHSTAGHPASERSDNERHRQMLSPTVARRSVVSPFMSADELEQAHAAAPPSPTAFKTIQIPQRSPSKRAEGNESMAAEAGESQAEGNSALPQITATPNPSSLLPSAFVTETLPEQPRLTVDALVAKSDLRDLPLPTVSSSMATSPDRATSDHRITSTATSNSPHPRNDITASAHHQQPVTPANTGYISATGTAASSTSGGSDRSRDSSTSTSSSYTPSTLSCSSSASSFCEDQALHDPQAVRDPEIDALAHFPAVNGLQINGNKRKRQASSNSHSPGSSEEDEEDEEYVPGSRRGRPKKKKSKKGRQTKKGAIAATTSRPGASLAPGNLTAVVLGDCFERVKRQKNTGPQVCCKKCGCVIWNNPKSMSAHVKRCKYAEELLQAVKNPTSTSVKGAEADDKVPTPSSTESASAAGATNMEAIGTNISDTLKDGGPDPDITAMGSQWDAHERRRSSRLSRDSAERLASAQPARLTRASATLAAKAAPVAFKTTATILPKTVCSTPTSSTASPPSSKPSRIILRLGARSGASLPNSTKKDAVGNSANHEEPLHEELAGPASMDIDVSPPAPAASVQHAIPSQPLASSVPETCANPIAEQGGAPLSPPSTQTTASPSIPEKDALTSTPTMQVAQTLSALDYWATSLAGPDFPPRIAPLHASKTTKSTAGTAYLQTHSSSAIPSSVEALSLTESPVPADASCQTGSSALATKSTATQSSSSSLRIKDSSTQVQTIQTSSKRIQVVPQSRSFAIQTETVKPALKHVATYMQAVQSKHACLQTVAIPPVKTRNVALQVPCKAAIGTLAVTSNGRSDSKDNEMGLAHEPGARSSGKRKTAKALRIEDFDPDDLEARLDGMDEAGLTYLWDKTGDSLRRRLERAPADAKLSDYRVVPKQRRTESQLAQSTRLPPVTRPWAGGRGHEHSNLSTTLVPRPLASKEYSRLRTIDPPCSSSSSSSSPSASAFTSSRVGAPSRPITAAPDASSNTQLHRERERSSRAHMAAADSPSNEQADFPQELQAYRRIFKEAGYLHVDGLRDSLGLQSDTVFVVQDLAKTFRHPSISTHIRQMTLCIALSETLSLPPKRPT